MPARAITKRSFLAASSLILGGALATACASRETRPQVRSGVNLTFMSTSGGADLETKARYAAAFGERHPGLKLEHLPVSSGGNVALYERLQAADLTHRHRVANVPIGGTAPFNQGKAAMALTGAYGFSALRQASGLRWGAAVVPRGPGGRFSSGSGVGWTMPAAGPNPEEAWLAFQYIASKEVQELEAGLGNVAPARKSVAYGPAFLDPSKPPKDVRVFADAGDFTHETPCAVAWPDIADVLADEFQPLWRGERTAKATIEALRPKVEGLLKN